MKIELKKWEVSIQIISLIFLTLTTVLIELYQDDLGDYSYSLLDMSNALIYNSGRILSFQEDQLSVKIDKVFGITPIWDDSPKSYGDEKIKSIYESYGNNTIDSDQYLDELHSYYVEKINDERKDLNDLMRDFFNLRDNKPKCFFEKIDCRQSISFLQILRIISIIILFIMFIIILISKK